MFIFDGTCRDLACDLEVHFQGNSLVNFIFAKSNTYFWFSIRKRKEIPRSDINYTITVNSSDYVCEVLFSLFTSNDNRIRTIMG